ncbi:ABC transporter [Penicillium hispanicum]|uniref:ABC transporter n=1 Tax=Penicillium hispanicum TaxID=1080232 RepID=UPI002540760D|nr:ABC transporter [Penicillium hispanicum]KAJ5579587.1 ABC transporter [Penicillium hispanicum]
MFIRIPLRVRALQPTLSCAARYVSSAPLIHIQDGTFYRQYPTGKDTAPNPPLYPNFDFTLPSDTSPPSDSGSALQHWAVIGTSGRTDLLDVLRGQHICIPPTARSFPYLLSDEIAAKDPRLRFVGNAIQYIGFSGEGSGAIGGTRGAYLSARYESHREETDWTVEQFLRGQMSLNPLEGEEKGTVHDEPFLQDVIANLRLGPLLDMPVANLSNGQTRRARIAQALLRKPELLLLDEPFMGLDPATVRSISELLHRLAQKSSPRLIIALRPQDAVPDWITHMVVVGNSHRVVQQGSRDVINRTLGIWQMILRNKYSSTLNAPDKKIYHRAKSEMEAGILDRQLLQDLTHFHADKEVKEHEDVGLNGEPLIEMDGVRVQYNDKVVLGGWQQAVGDEMKDGLHWRVRRGQRWAILGANGSGKTTLLSLITSDHPQTYAQPIKLFGRSRLPEAGRPGISIFELQSRLGHSSPEIHAFFPRQLTVREALESAFAETFLSKPNLNLDRDIDVSAALRFFRPELDPSMGVTDKKKNKKASVEKKNSNLFPTLPVAKNPEAYPPTDYDVEYADTIQFGQLSIAQQRIVLFLRALIHKPDIVILDEPFSGLSASQRDKCLHYIDYGDSPFPLGPDPPEPSHFGGLSGDQALVLISHVKEEIPDSVRYYMRLPSELGDGFEPLDFRFGRLKKQSTLSEPAVWDTAWSPASVFRQEDRRTHRCNDEENDMTLYQWFSI